MRRVLLEAGFSKIALDPYDFSLDMGVGRGLDAAVVTALESGPTSQPRVPRSAVPARSRGRWFDQQGPRAVPQGPDGAAGGCNMDRDRRRSLDRDIRTRRLLSGARCTLALSGLDKACSNSAGGWQAKK